MQPSQYKCKQLQYKFAVITEASSTLMYCMHNMIYYSELNQPIQLLIRLIGCKMHHFKQLGEVSKSEAISLFALYSKNLQATHN